MTSEERPAYGDEVDKLKQYVGNQQTGSHHHIGLRLNGHDDGLACEQHYGQQEREPIDADMHYLA